MYVLLVMKGWRSYEVQHWWMPAGQLETDNIVIIIVIIVFIIIVIIFVVIIIILLIISWLSLSISHYHHHRLRDHHHYRHHHHYGLHDYFQVHYNCCHIMKSSFFIFIVRLLVILECQWKKIAHSYSTFSTQVMKRAMTQYSWFFLFLHIFLLPPDTWRPKVYILKILFEDIERGEGTYWTSFSPALPLSCILSCICITYELYLYHISQEFPFSCTPVAYLYCI